ncbi:MAG TPA: DUF2461 domain-containing protein [Solirubrobacteraceae bacterium]
MSTAEAFRGFTPEAFAWFAGLEADNSRDYFARTRPLFEDRVRGELEALLDELCDEVGGRDVKVFRQHRDLRFSADKSPYKTRTYGVIVGAPGGALYAEVSAAGLYAGTGYYRMARDQLERFRDAVAAEETGPALASAVAATRGAGLRVDGATLKTAPRGYPRDHPRVELLRHTSVISGRRLGPEGGIGRAAALDHVGGTWRAAGPVNAWLDEHVGPSTLPPDPRGRR